MSVECTVIMPTHNHAPLLKYSIGSVLDQTLADFELVVIGDGVGDDTRSVMEELCREDPRLRFIDEPKSPRTGEPYRHAFLATCESPWVTYCADDDLLMPYHLEVVREYLEGVNLVHGYGAFIDADGAIEVTWADLGRADQRERELGAESLAGLTGMAHTMDAYRRLPYGWRTTPAGTFTDHYMYQQFLADPSVTVRGVPIPTSLQFPSVFRRSWTLEERTAELRDWSARIADPSPWTGIAGMFAAASYEQGIDSATARRALAHLCEQRDLAVTEYRTELERRDDDIARLEAALREVSAEREAMQQTRTWKLRHRLLRLWPR